MPDSDRVAELKRKMQERAKQVKAAAGEAEAATPAPAPAQQPAAEQPAAQQPAAQQATAADQVAEAVATTTPAPAADLPARVDEESVPAGTAAAGPSLAEAESATPTEPAADATRSLATPAPVSTNGDSAPAAEVFATPDGFATRQLTPEEQARREMNRREFLTYAWAGALLLVGGATGFGIFEFMYPRFRAGEFGGEFFVSMAEVPATDAPPVAKTDGKFWLVQSESEGPKAIYMVCTHLGCLYKWEPSTVRFECPCHGSKFTKDGFYIEGPASRSLDTFDLRVEGDTVVVDTGSKTLGAPAVESPARAATA